MSHRWLHRSPRSQFVMRSLQCHRAGPVNLVFGRHTSDFSEIERRGNTHENDWAEALARQLGLARRHSRIRSALDRIGGRGGGLVVGPNSVTAKTSGRTPLYRRSRPVARRTPRRRRRAVSSRTRLQQKRAASSRTLLRRKRAGSSRTLLRRGDAASIRTLRGGVWAEGRGPQGGVRAWRLWVSAAELAVAPVARAAGFSVFFSAVARAR